MAKLTRTIPALAAAFALVAGCGNASKPMAAKKGDAVPQYVGAPTTLPVEVAPQTPAGNAEASAADDGAKPATEKDGGGSKGGASTDGSGPRTVQPDRKDGPRPTQPPGPVLRDGADDVKLVGCESVGGVAFAKVSIKNSTGSKANYLVMGTASLKDGDKAKPAKPAKNTKGTAKPTTAELVGGTVVQPGESTTINLSGGGLDGAVMCRIDKVSRF